MGSYIPSSSSGYSFLAGATSPIEKVVEHFCNKYQILTDSDGGHIYDHRYHPYKIIETDMGEMHKVIAEVLMCYNIIQFDENSIYLMNYDKKRVKDLIARYNQNKTKDWLNNAEYVCSIHNAQLIRAQTPVFIVKHNYDSKILNFHYNKAYLDKSVL